MVLKFEKKKKKRKEKKNQFDLSRLRIAGYSGMWQNRAIGGRNLDRK